MPVSIARDNEIPIKIFSILRNNCFKNVYNNSNNILRLTMFEIIKDDITSRMDSSIQSFKSDMQGIRAGRASPSMLDSIRLMRMDRK